MNTASQKQLNLRGVLRINEPMSKHTSWKTGGNADRLYIPADLDDLAVFLQQQTEGEEITFIGLGSNVLVSDKGIRGTVVLMKGSKGEIKLTENTLIVDASVSCAKISRYASGHNLPALAFLSGIPGTLGGALAMNAGAFGSEIWQFVDRVKMINQQGEILELAKEQFKISYRKVISNVKGWFVQASFNIEACRQQTADNIKTLLEKRKQTQPIGLPSCGSVFTNPPGNHAAKLIEQSGLKGERIGDAQVSTKHANFIINLGHAKARDIAQLIKKIQKTVMEKFAVELKPEVHFIGDWKS